MAIWGFPVGMMDRDWYRERFARRVIGIQGPIDDPTGEPARIRRGVAKPRPQLPPGAQSGSFWAWAVLVLLALVGAGVLASCSDAGPSRPAPLLDRAEIESRAICQSGFVLGSRLLLVHLF